MPIKSRTTPFFDYGIPAKLEGEVRPGTLVIVPFRTRRLPGVVMALSETPSVPHVRPIQRVLTEEPVLTPSLLHLARWMARETLAPLHECVKAILPPGLRPRTEMVLKAQVAQVPGELPANAEALLRLLIRRGALRRSQVRSSLRGVNWQRAIPYLRSRKLIVTETIQRLPQVRPQKVRLVTLAAPRNTWEEGLAGLQLVDLYRNVLHFLEKERAPVEVGVVYAETEAQYRHVKMLQERGLVGFSSEERIRDPLEEFIFTPVEAPTLLSDQLAVWQEIDGSLGSQGEARPVLLLGVTGSGKTEIYLRATARVLEQGRQALILVPEISLTPQTVRRFVVRFPEQVGVWHSGMSDGERYDTWRRVRSGELQVLVGARSALFAPFPRLGLVVLDEEEDTSYKQGRRPYYHAREVAEELARETGALLILGSATPSLEAYRRALEGRYRLLKMPRRILSHRRRITDWQRYLQLPASRYRALPEAQEVYTISLPPVQIVDMRAELKAGNRSIFSRPLQEAVDRALSREEQVILFLNRRGTATHVFCRDCGWVASCPRCDIPLTFHARADLLLCHHCAYDTSMVRRCEECGSRRVRAFGLGTEGLEQRVAERWPDARRLRWDRDVARNHAAHTSLLARFATGEADLLVGTQMIARGLDLPAVTVVGVISADVGLHLPDFRAAERSFQLLAQVAGRAGRGLLGGQAFLQTYHPDHYAIQHAAVHDYVGFAQRELTFRREAGYPPTTRMARLLFLHPRAGKARRAAQQLATRLRHALEEEGGAADDLIGPAPAFFARIRGRYRWQILLRHVDPAAFLRRMEIPAGWRVDVDPVDVL